MKISTLGITLMMIISMTYSITPMMSQPINFTPRTIYYQDMDGDGYGNPLKTIHSTTQPEGYVSIDGDCDDTDNKITTGILYYFFEDKDQDGYGNGESLIRSCSQPKGYVTNSLDCDDEDAKSGKGVLNTYIRDLDGDGYGDVNFFKRTCKQLKGYVLFNYDNSNIDCDDTDPNIHGGITDLYYLDEDGDGIGNVSEIGFFCQARKGWTNNPGDGDDHDPKIGQCEFKSFIKDNDQDGYGDNNFWAYACEAPKGYIVPKNEAYPYDCDDNNKSVGAGKFIFYYIDRDKDGLGDSQYSLYSCGVPNGYVDNSDDCDDNDANLPRFFYIDKDHDGYGDFSGKSWGCFATKDYVDNYNDCDDNDRKVGPGENKTYWLDNDGDGLGNPNQSVFLCIQPKYYVTNNQDCDDKNPKIFGGSLFYKDGDGDGFGGDAFEVACKPDKGYVASTGDCNDKDPKIHPGGLEVCNGVDDNCNESIDEGKTMVSIEGFSGNGYLCSNVEPILLKGKPAGGIFSIDGVQTSILDPANFKYDGAHKIEYAVSVDGCTTKIYARFKKVEVTEARIFGLKGSYVQNDPPIKMALNDTSYSISGNSQYGEFLIDGIKGTIFNPGILDTGIHQIIFRINTNTGGVCSSEVSKSVRIISANPCPFFAQSNACYLIINKKSHKYLNMAKGSSKEGTAVIQSDFYPFSYLRWGIRKETDGTYSISSLNTGNQIEDNTPYLGSSIVQKRITSNYPSGSWRIQCTDKPGYYKIVSLKNGYVMDIMAQSDATGAQAIAWYFTGHDNQYWKIVQVDCANKNAQYDEQVTELNTSDNSNDSDILTVYPTPARDYIFIKSSVHDGSDVIIYNQLGQKVITSKFNEESNTLKLFLPRDHFPQGMYIVEVKSGTQIISKKFLVID